MENNTMKNIFKITAMACLMAASLNSMAADGPSANVSIKGTVKMGACTPTLDNGGVVDFGNISTDTLSSNTENQLTTKYLNMQIVCSGDTLLQFTTTDNRQDTVVMSTVIENAGVNNTTVTKSNNLFGLGKTSKSVNIGSWVAAFDYTSMNTNITDTILIQQSSHNGVWGAVVSGLWADGVEDFRDFSLAKADDSSTPVAFSSLDMNIKISADIDKNIAKTIDQEEVIDGNATISISYL